MSRLSIRFHDELNDFLRDSQQGKMITQDFDGNPAVKHIIEALGVPHTEVERIEINSEGVDFFHHVLDGDNVEVFPYTIHSRLMKMRSHGIARNNICFILDNHLGKLANYLRMLGFDVLYRNDYQDAELARIASQDARVLLTRDRRLLMRKVIEVGYWIRSKIPREQLMEVVRNFSLEQQITPFRRCLECNGSLQPIRKEVVLDRLEPLTKKYYQEFYICEKCQKIYWKGSHYQRMLKFIDGISEKRDFIDEKT